MDRKTEVKTYRINKVCPICKQGDMIPTGMVLAGNPPLYQHKCTVCGRQEAYRDAYPHIVYEDIVKEEPKAAEDKNVLKSVVTLNDKIKSLTKQRVKEEHSELADRLLKLDDLIKSPTFKQEFNSEERDLLTRQSNIMHKYIDILKKLLYIWRDI